MSQIKEPESATVEPTEEQWAQAMEWLRAHPYGEQDENGIDISLLRENLKLTPTQRIENNMRALRLFKEFDRAAEASRLSRILSLESLRKLKRDENL